ncbi:MAG TPA: isochorismatase family cysteine hydrolase [Gemmataceae bacterium]|nr:isochorismatase family cysteine hydrolase [Gemmataceae bacterium]
MPATNDTLDGNAPDQCPVALLLVDVINPLDFPNADELLRFALPMADRLAELKRRARAAGVPVVYANDNFGRWRSDLAAVVERCRRAGCMGAPLAEKLAPHPDDYFVLKPKHSAFYSTALDLLLRHLGTETLVVGGVATDICVLFTANDAYMREFRVVVPADGVAANSADRTALALDQMHRELKCETPASADIDFAKLIHTRGNG